MAEAKTITVEVLRPPGAAVLLGDAARLEQVMWNLLSNATKFTPPGGHIRVRVSKTDALVQVEVSDNGQGIPADFIPHIFDRFKQADRDKGAPHSGLGLGLTLVRQMVQAHGGTVIAESAGEGHGSTFTVTLPVTGPARPLTEARPIPL